MSNCLEVISGATVVICCGPGGVGKTTVSASLAIALAEQGKRVCVMTVDPARRLADVLGISTISNEPSVVAAVKPGVLSAMMLDTASTFDRLIDRYAPTLEQAETIRSTRIYQAMVSSLGGTQEYMAMEKLYELQTSGNYDVIVVDTPPTRNALELLDAPQRITQLFENRLFRALLMPTKAYLRAFGLATQAMLKAVSSAAGAELVADAVAFLQAFAGMEEGFVERSNAMRALLRAETTRYVVVTAPRADAVAEAMYFAEQLQTTGTSVAALIVNRRTPDLGDYSETAKKVESKAFAALVDNLNRMHVDHEAEAALVDQLIARAGAPTVVELPLVADDSHDLAGLRAMAAGLSGAKPRRPRRRE
jgi:anion-transporting  ArsA/GET3 family ATPase